MQPRKPWTKSNAISTLLRRHEGNTSPYNLNLANKVKGRPRLKRALADAYSPFFGRIINPDTEVTITTGANEGMLSAFMGFIEPGDEVIIFEPFFDQ